MKINTFQAKVILKIKNDFLTASDIWVRFDGDYSYQYISQALSLLEKIGLVIKLKSGRKTFYKATEDAVTKAEEILKNEFKKGNREDVEAVGTNSSGMSELPHENESPDVRDEEMLRLQQDV